MNKIVLSLLFLSIALIGISTVAAAHAADFSSDDLGDVSDRPWFGTDTHPLDGLNPVKDPNGVNLATLGWHNPGRDPRGLGNNVL